MTQLSSFSMPFFKMLFDRKKETSQYIRVTWKTLKPRYFLDLILLVPVLLSFRDNSTHHKTKVGFVVSLTIFLKRFICKWSYSVLSFVQCKILFKERNLSPVNIHCTSIVHLLNNINPNERGGLFLSASSSIRTIYSRHKQWTDFCFTSYCLFCVLAYKSFTIIGSDLSLVFAATER